MYKPTTYIKAEVDRAHATEEGMGMLNRVFGFIDPLTFEPARELGLTVRLKCRNRPYWDLSDPVQDSMWTEVVGPYLNSKLDIILDVLRECNNKRYAHYVGPLHMEWLKLQMDLYEVRFRLDHDANDASYLPEAFDLLCKVRETMGTPEFKAFESGVEGIVAYVPSREIVDRQKALREEEAVAWDARKEPLDAGGGSAGEAAEADKPVLAPGISYATVEFARADGVSIVCDMEKGSWNL